ncbi:hypothetical protein [Asanoa iriomotensis]|uniref:Uncharacterized protein n=1 Tax=Asanoa iriomotensis TaxID=234613 RepID=A0ABQ4CBI5_9ACTN|nr:hypothetical protein [Asanoa iriomotensis]GIF59680.1 hypothetical protein Air01nite_57750 [Asanoa iriomotensis]
MFEFLLVFVVVAPAPALALGVLVARLRRGGALARLWPGLRGGVARPVWIGLVATVVFAGALTAGLEQAYLAAMPNRPERGFDTGLLALVIGQFAVVLSAALAAVAAAAVARARGFGAGAVAGVLTLVAVGAGAAAAHLPLRAYYLANPSSFPPPLNLGEGGLLVPFDAFLITLAWALPWPVIGAALATRGRRRPVRDLPQLVLDLATSDLPANRAAWGAALRAELAAIDPPAERRRFARGGAWAALRTGPPRGAWLVGAGVAVVVALGTLAASRWSLAHGGGGVLGFWAEAPTVVLFVVALLAAWRSRSFGAGLRGGIVAGLGALVAVVAVGIPEAILWTNERAGFLSTGDAVPPDWQTAVRDTLRPEFLIGMALFWTTATAGGAALGAALARLHTRTSDEVTAARVIH